MKNTTLFLATGAVLLSASSAFAAGALSVSREVTVDSSPATVWKLVGGFNALDVWHPAVANSTVKGNATSAGAIRTLTLGDGAKITEKLLTYSAAKTSYSYAILSGPLPVKNYVSTISLSPTSDGKTSIKWSSTFDAAGAPDAKATEVIGGVYDGGLAKVVANFKK
jgi:mxaD protein